MLRRAQVAATERERFMQQALEQMLAFEQREAELRKQDRLERAEHLHLPLNPEELH